ncbi:MAG: hypothetical protein Q9213_002732 [Squamulea squamosa]
MKKPIRRRDPRNGESLLKRFPHLTSFEGLLSACNVVSTALRSKPFVSVREILAQCKSAQGLTPLPADESYAMQYIFTVIGELTMLFTPSPEPTPDFFQINVGDLGPWAQPSRIWQYDRVPMTGATPFIGDLLRRFGGKNCPVPRLKGPSLNEHTPNRETESSIVTLNLCFYTLDRLAGITIVWTSSWCEHLELDVRQKKLKLFKYPSLCLIMALGGGTIYDLLLKDYDSDTIASEIDSDVCPGGILMREILTTYRLIFGQHSHSRRLYRKRAKQYLKPLPGDDPLISHLCGGDWTKEKVYEEFYIGGAKTVYSITHDFPHIGDRLLSLQRFVLVQSPDDWLSLWRDRREPLRFWTLWAVVFIGMYSVTLGILQVGLAIAQTVGSFGN